MSKKPWENYTSENHVDPDTVVVSEPKKPWETYAEQPLKKKESASPGTNDSLTPAEPSEKSTPSVTPSEKTGNWVQDNYDQWANKKLADYQKRLSTDISDFTKSLALGQPDTTDQKQVDEYNNKVQQLNQFQSKKQQEYNDQFELESKAESDKINATLGKFDKLKAERNKPSVSAPIIPTPGDPFGIGQVVAKTVASGFQHQLPAAIAAIPAMDTQTYEENLMQNLPTEKKGVIAGKLFKDALKNLEIGKAFSVGDKEIQEEYLKQLGPEVTKKGKEAFITGQRQKATEAFEKASGYNAERGKALEGIPQSYQDIKSADDAVKYVSYQLGQSLPTMAASVGAPGIGSYLLEAGDAYTESVEQIAKQKGIDPKEVVKQGLDMPAKETASTVGLVNAALDLGGLGAIAGSVRKMFTKELSKAIVKKGLASKMQSAITNPLFIEPITESLQEFNTSVASKVAGGMSLKDANTEAWKEYPRYIDAAIGGLIGVSPVAVAQVVKSPESTIQEQTAKVKPGDAASAEQAAATIEQTLNQAPNAVQEPSTSSVVSQPQSGTTEAGSERGGVGPSQQGAPTTQEGQTQGPSAPVAQEVTTQAPEGKVGEGPKPQADETIPLAETQKPESGLTKPTETPALTEEQLHEMEPDMQEGNYVKKAGSWYLINKDGVHEKVIDLNKPATDSFGNEAPEISHLKTVLKELEGQDVSDQVTSDPKERARIKELPRTSLLGRVRGYFLDGGKIRWAREADISGKGKVGAGAETGLGEAGRKNLIGVQDKNGLSPEQIAEKLFTLHGDDNRFTEQNYRDAVIDILTSEDRAKWLENQRADEDIDIGLRRQNVQQEASDISSRIEELEIQEEAAKTQTKEQYENERRVHGGKGQGASSQSQQGQGKPEPAALIQQNGDKAKSQSAATELAGLKLTHVPGLGMGQNQAKGTYLSTEKEGNRYATEENEALPATAKADNPFVSDNGQFYEVQRAAIQQRFGKESIDDLTEAEVDLLAEMMTDYFAKEGYDSIYFPQSETQEGELIVFDKSKVKIGDGNTKNEADTVSRGSQQEGGRSQQEDAENITRGVQEAGTSTPGAQRSDRQLKKEQDQQLEANARKTGTFIEDVNETFGKKIDGGTEQDVHLNKEGDKVIKVNGLSNHSSWAEFWDRLNLQKQLFPNTAYKLIGFTKSGGRLSAVMEQPFVKGTPVPRQELIEDLAKRGFYQIHPEGSLGQNQFYNPELGVRLSDVHGENVIKDAAGNIRYIDPMLDRENPFVDEESQKHFNDQKAKYETPSSGQATPPPAKPTTPSGATESGGPIYNNQAIYSGKEKTTGANIKPELSDTKYDAISNDLTIAEAKRIVESNPLATVEEAVFNEANDMHDALRRATAIELAKAYRAAGDQKATSRVFDKYRKLGTKAAQSVQVGNIAAEDPLVQTMELVAKNDEDNQTIRDEVQPDGKKTGKKLDDTKKEIDGLAKKFGVEVSESETLDTMLTKILAKGIPKSERINIATKRVKDAGDALKNTVATILENAATKHLVLDQNNPTHKPIVKALTDFISAVADKTTLEIGDQAGNLANKIIEQVKKFLEKIGVTMPTSELNTLIDNQVQKLQEKKSKPPVVKVIIADIKDLIKQHYSVQEEQQKSIADKLIAEYNLTGADALAIQKEVEKQFDAKMKKAADASLSKLYGTSTLKQPKSKTKGDADKIIEAINMGAFNDEFYTNLVGQKFGISEFTKDDITKLETMADQLQKLPSGELRNNKLREFKAYIAGLQNVNREQKLMDAFMSLWYASALSGYSTQSRSLKANIVNGLASLMVASLANPYATLKGLGGLKSLMRGWNSFGRGTWTNILSTGVNPFGEGDTRPLSWLQKLTNKPFKEIIANKEYGQMLAKPWISLIVYMGNGLVATDAMFRYISKENEAYILAYNKLLNEGGNKFEESFWNKLHQELALDKPTLEASEAQLEQELADLKGEEIPRGYEQRRLQEITDGKRNEDLAKGSIENANRNMLMNEPIGLLGALYRTMVKAGEISKVDEKLKDKRWYKAQRKAEMMGKLVYRMTFPFLRIASNQINRNISYTPLGLIHAGLMPGYTEAGGKRAMTADERTRHFIMAGIGTTVATTLAMSMFDDDDEEGLKLDDESPIQVTGLGLGQGKFQENKDLFPDRQDLSFRIKNPITDEWSDWYTYRDAPIGMVLFPLGQASDDIRYKKFKEDAAGKDEKERTVGSYLATAGHWAMQFATSQSYQQGIRNMLDLIGFDQTGNASEKAVKAAISPIKAVLMPNLYKQTYTQMKSILDQTEKKAYTVPEQIMKDIPLVESLIENDAYDQLGYPIVKKFDWPLVPDVILDEIKENRDYRLTKPEWELVYKYPEVTLGERFRAPDKIKVMNPILKKPTGEIVELSDPQKSAFTKFAGESLRDYISDNMNNLKKMPALELQKELNDYREWSYQDAKSLYDGYKLIRDQQRMERRINRLAPKPNF